MSIFLYCLRFFINAFMGFVIGWMWYKGEQYYAIGGSLFLILESISGLRDRINDIQWGKS